MHYKREVAAALEVCHTKNSTSPGDAPRCFIGFDGFTDEILSAVETRTDGETFHPFAKIADFGQRIVNAAGKSSNIELVFKREKLGGNAPILTNALLEGGHRIAFSGAIGLPDAIEPLFQEMADRCEAVFPLCPSAHSDAIEFTDGKIILGKLQNLQSVNYETLIKHVGLDTLISLLDNGDLLVAANWTMLPKMTDLWRCLQQEVIPHFKNSTKKRSLFVDLADPAKRSKEDLAEAVEVLGGFAPAYRVFLGLNLSEALLTASALGLEAPEETEALARAIQDKSGLHQIVLHATDHVSAATADTVVTVQGAYYPHPVLTTGAGDNFNAGFCNGLLFGFDEEETLLSGVATSGYYVSHGKSPTMLELANFLREWDAKGEPPDVPTTKVSKAKPT